MGGWNVLDACSVVFSTVSRSTVANDLMPQRGKRPEDKGRMNLVVCCNLDETTVVNVGLFVIDELGSFLLCMAELLSRY